MRTVIVHTLRFLLFVAAQTLIFNQFEIGLGIHPMIYPLFIMLLPFEIGVVTMLFIAFATGIVIDALSDTYGLHTSALLVFAYLRPLIFKAYSPRDGYEGMGEGNIFSMGQRWFFFTFGLLLTIHHTWFFMIEVFKLNELLYVLRKLALSVPVSYIFCILLQFIFLKRSKAQ